jgi:peptidyl-prolyl cis-trans isomerase SurA
MIATRAMSFGRTAAIVVVAMLVVRPAVAEIVNRIVATVDGDPITAYEVRRYGEERQARGATGAALLEAVITDRILAKEIVARKIVAKREDIDRYVAETRERNKMTQEQFVAALKQQGMTLEQYHTRVKSEMERTQLLGQELRGDPVAVSDDDVARFYEEHKDQFAQRSGVTVSDIFLAFRQDMTRAEAMRVMEQAKSIKQMLDNGQSFSAVARRYSQGPGAESGGLLGSFKRGEMAAPLEQVAFALRVGEVSQPIPGPNGIHLLKLDAVQASGYVGFDEVKDEIRQQLQNQALDERFREWIAKNLRDRHHVEVIN